MNEAVFDCDLGRNLTDEEIAERRTAGLLAPPPPQDPEPKAGE